MRRILFFTVFLFSFSAFAQSMQNCNPTLDSNTVIIKSDTTFSCSYGEFLICPGVKVTYNDNSCNAIFYLEPNAQLIFDSLNSYGYSSVWSKSTSMFDANFTQYMNLHHENGSVLKDTNVNITQNFFCNSITYNYSKLPGGVSGCPTTGRKEFSLSNIEFEVYPNPAKNYIQINTSMVNYTATLYNSLGEVIWKGNSNYIELNQPEGIYYLQIENLGKRLTKKIVIY